MNDATLPMATVSHSVLHPDFLAAEVSRRYALGKAMTGFLLYRGMNDVYLISNGREKFALRVWRKTWRAVDDVAYELNFLIFCASGTSPPPRRSPRATAISISK